MASSLLSIRDLQVRFAIHGTTLDAVRGVSFDIQPQSTVALVGESGSGKSVIARSIMGLLPQNAAITGGQIILNDPDKNIDAVDIASLPSNGRKMRSFRGGNISLIFQEPMVSLSALHTIGDQVSEALFLHRKMKRAEGLKITRDMLATVGFVDPDRTLMLYPFELSGGMRQRAMIAMALICHPSLLIADEPTTALDVTIQAQILKLIKHLQKEINMAVLLITHDLGVVANIARDVVVLYHGEVMESGTAEQIFDSPRHEYTRALLKAVPQLEMDANERLTPIREIKIDTRAFQRDNEQRDNDTTQSQPANKHILEVRDISKHFSARKNSWALFSTPPKIQAVTGVSFNLRRGECLGLVGESGSGKSTLGKMIAHAILPDDGQIKYFGAEGTYQVHSMDKMQLLEYRRKVQYIFQDPVGSLNPSMTLFDIIREPMVIHRMGDLDYQAEKSSELMRLVGIDPRHLRRYPHSFSGGQRQRIGIARALALRPDLLICDEPVSALDVSIQAQVLNLLKDLQSELGLSYLFISHNLAVINYISDRIAVMYDGKFVEVANREALFKRPTHPYTKILLEAIPRASLKHLIDFDKIADPSANQSHDQQKANFPDEYVEQPNRPSKLYEISPGHLVRAVRNPVQL